MLVLEGVSFPSCLELYLYVLGFGLDNSWQYTFWFCFISDSRNREKKEKQLWKNGKKRRQKKKKMNKRHSQLISYITCGEYFVVVARVLVLFIFFGSLLVALWSYGLLSLHIQNICPYLLPLPLSSCFKSEKVLFDCCVYVAFLW